MSGVTFACSLRARYDAPDLGLDLLACAGDSPTLDQRGVTPMGLTPFEWFKIAASIAAFIAGAAVWIWGQDKARSVSFAVTDDKIAHLVERLKGIDHRLDRAGKKSSDEADRVMVKIADLSERIVRLETRIQT